MADCAACRLPLDPGITARLGWDRHATCFPPDEPLPRPTGEQLAIDGMRTADEAEPDTWKTRADETITALAASGKEFTAEDVRDAAGDPAHPNAMGARLNAHAKAGLITSTGYTKASRASRHTNLLRVWKGTA